jgi:tetratricopeptide (TPR) repeat protein
MNESDALEAQGVALVNRGLQLWGQGSRDEAVVTMRQGVAVCRQLAAVDIAKVNHLALALSNLGGMLHEWGRSEEAIPVLEHSIKITRIYSDRGHEFAADLAGALKNLGTAFQECGRASESIAALSESVQIYRELVDQGRREYEVALAGALNSLGNGRGLVAEARGDFDAAVSLLRKEDYEGNDEAAMLLALTLASQCGVLMHLADNDQAVGNSEEAVAILRQLGASKGAEVEPYLGRVLVTRAAALRTVGRLEEANTDATEAVAIVRRCYRANPDGWRAELIRGLRQLADLLPLLNRHREAADIAEEIERLIEEDRHDDKPTHQHAVVKSKASFFFRFKRRH